MMVVYTDACGINAKMGYTFKSMESYAFKCIQKSKTSLFCSIHYLIQINSTQIYMIR